MSCESGVNAIVTIVTLYIAHRNGGEGDRAIDEAVRKAITGF